LCRRVMARGRMPYAHLDLIITDAGTPYLSEISLNGGLQGAEISKTDLDRLKHDLLLRMTEEKEQ
jgi:hypothetical protein